jgi:hypothetical protein
VIAIVGLLALGGIVVLLVRSLQRRRDRITPEDEEWHPGPPSV